MLVRDEFERKVLQGLQQFDLHHHSQLRHEFGRFLLHWLQQFDLHLYAPLHTS